ncbi:peptidoglycan-binding protein [Streptomyces phaeochromogenes]|uniref:peptidoglycan-binding protein n=1 Tax=Streptomyces phaeochromogenes TaxID=1923 RepID=UPI002E2C5245|nr:peptidoglycan-binding protein [Streptomyces phaeochromogenes]
MSYVSTIVEIAKKEVGYHEGKSGGHWNNDQKYSDQVPGLEWSDGMAWCATFVYWCAYKASAGSLFPKTASCATGVSWYKKANRWSEYPAKGAQVFFGAGGGTHTGLVYDYDDTYVYTVEGNTNLTGSPEGDGVYFKKRLRRDSYVYGYGLPKYPDGIESADPKYASEKPKPSVPAQPSKPKPTKPVAPAFPGRNLFKVGQSNKWVTHLDKVLIKAGFAKHKAGKTYTPGPEYTTYTRDNVKDFQKSKGWTGSDADGLVGPETWKQLHLKAGYRVA